MAQSTSRQGTSLRTSAFKSADKKLALLLVVLVAVVAGALVYRSRAAADSCGPQDPSAFRCDAKNFTKTDAVALIGSARIVNETSSGLAGTKVAELYNAPSRPRIELRTKAVDFTKHLKLQVGKKYGFCAVYNVNGQVKVFAPTGDPVTTGPTFPGTGGQSYKLKCHVFTYKGGNGDKVSLHFPNSAGSNRTIRITAISLKPYPYNPADYASAPSNPAPNPPAPNPPANSPSHGDKIIISAAQMSGGKPVYATVNGQRVVAGRKLSSAVSFTKQLRGSARSRWFMCINARDLNGRPDRVRYGISRVGVTNAGAGSSVQILNGWYKTGIGPAGGNWKFGFTGNDSIVLRKVSLTFMIDRCG